jgi:hypothetical protein
MGIRENNHGISGEVWGCSSRTTHLRSSSQEVFDGHEGLFAAKANNGERFFLRLSKYLTSLYGVRVCQQL